MNFIRNFLQGKESSSDENFVNQQVLNYNGESHHNIDLHDEISTKNEFVATDTSGETIDYVSSLQDDTLITVSNGFENKEADLHCESISPHDVLAPLKSSNEYFDCQESGSLSSVEESTAPVVIDNHNVYSESNSVNNGVSNNCDANENVNFNKTGNVSGIREAKSNCTFLEISFEDAKPLKPLPPNLSKKGKHSHRKKGGGKFKATDHKTDCGSTTPSDSSLGTSAQSEPLAVVNSLNDIDKYTDAIDPLIDCDFNLTSVNSNSFGEKVDNSASSKINLLSGQCYNDESNNSANIIEDLVVDHSPVESTEAVDYINVASCADIQYSSLFIVCELSDTLVDKNKSSDSSGNYFPEDYSDNRSDKIIDSAADIEFQDIKSDALVDVIPTDLDSINHLDDIKLPSESNLNSVEELSKDSNTEQNKDSCISISCFGSEEFEKLGNEANRLAAELTSSSEVILCNKVTMEEAGVSLNKNSSSKSETFKNINFDFDFDSDQSFKKESRQKCETAMVNNKNKNENHILQLQVNQSEAGPEIATGLTSSDLKCASLFFKEAAELESQIRKNIAASSFNSLSDYASESSDSDSCNKAILSGMPPNEERSAPEGTSSPDPRSHEDSEDHDRLRVTRDGDDVNELLKKQAMEFEEKLLCQGIVAAEKEKQLHEAMKGERGRLQKVTASRDALLKLVEQYKGMLAALVAEKNKQSTNDDVTISSMEKEKQQAIEDLANVEAAFSDVHRKYERTKQIVDTLKRNEETLRNAVADYEDKLQKQEKKFIELQKHAEEKVKEANGEFENLRRSNDQEMIKMGALLKKAEMKIITLQDALERKSRENQELTQLCDDLISKVGSS